MNKAVYKKDGEWWHTDEVQCDEYGPFDTELEAEFSLWCYFIEGVDGGDLTHLIISIEKHDDLYWNKQEPEVSDVDYDLMKRVLKKYDPEHPILNKVHSTVASGKKIKHDDPMLSLDKVYTVEELIKWCKKVARNDKEQFIFQPKYDGCSGRLENYKTKILATRGNGTEGEDITHKLSVTKIKVGDDEYIKLTQYARKGEVRGEILITNHDWEKYKDTPIRKGGQLYKNSRNACAGILNRDDNVGIPDDILTLVPFNLHNIVIDYNDLEDKVEQVLNEISGYDYPMDGVVIKIFDQTYKDSLGKTSNHYHGEIAFKFTNPTGNTMLTNIEWVMGKRKLTPRGHVVPVNVSGITISHVNLHNAKYLIDNDICINDRFVVERAGDVIPDYVKHISKPQGRFKSIIKECPFCKHSVEYIEPELYCTNPRCKEKLLNRLCDSVTRVGIERLGKPTVEKMMIQLEVKSLKDIFNLTKKEIIKMDGFAESSTNNLFNEINKVKGAGIFDWQVLASLNIHGIGRRLSKQILSVYTIQEIMTDENVKLSDLPNMGTKRASELYNGLGEDKDYIYELLETLPVKQTKGEVKEDMEKICFTGKMPEKRSYYEAIAKERGLEPSGTVNKDLNTLVCVDPNSTSSKMVKARKLGINVISVAEFMGE